MTRQVDDHPMPEAAPAGFDADPTAPVILPAWRAPGADHQDMISEPGRAERASAAEHEGFARLQAVIEAAVDGIITIDERGIIESVNPAAVRMFGYSAEEMIGRNVGLLMPEPYRGEHDRYISNYLRTGVRKIIGIGREVQGRRRDGSVFPVELAVSETRLGDRRIFTGIIRDITRRCQAEQALRESEERFAAFMRHLPGAAWIKDPAGRYVFSNAEQQRVANMTLDELRGKTDEEIFPPDTARQFRENDRRVLEEGQNLETIEVLREADGADHRFLVRKFVIPGGDGQQTCTGGIALDITARLAAEEALGESEERFATFMRHLPGAAWVKDLAGRYVYANAEAQRIFNSPLEELRGKTDHEVFPEETARQFRQNDRRVLQEGGSLQTIEVLRQADGVDHRSIVSKFAIPGADGQPVCIGGVAFDITEWLAAEDALRTSEGRFRRMADSAPAMIWMKGADGAYTWFNRRWLDFTGRTMEQELGYGWIEGIHPDDRDSRLRICRETFKARQPYELEYRLRRHDGEYRWVHDAAVPLISDDGSFGGYIGSCVDVTERRQSEELLRSRVRERAQELAATNERLREEIEQRRRVELLLARENRVLEQIAGGAAVESVLESLCGFIEELLPGSRSAIRLLRMREARPPNGPQPEVEPVPGVDLFGSQMTASLAPPACTRRTIVESVRMYRAGSRLRHNGIESFWFEPIVAPSGETLGVLAVYRDSEGAPDPPELAAGAAAARLAAVAIERARSEERARQQLAQLAHVSRLATMGEMASGLAHELNQPLCAIVNYMEACGELLSGAAANPAELRKALADVARQAERAGEVIRRLREFVCRREPQRETVDLNDVVREVIALTRVEARHNEVRVRLRLSKGLPRAMADPIQIQQVLVNLVRNALDAMRDTEFARRTLTIQTSRQPGAVRVSVSDAGPGVPEPARERLFEPFFSTKRDGMGMGLSISRSIVEAHEGRIWVAANRQRGATFRFTLPALGRKNRGPATNRVRGG